MNEQTLNIEDRAEQKLDELVAHRGGQRREPQVRLARGLARHQKSGKPLIVQAPTGSGKSYAALAAARAEDEDSALEMALSSGRKTIIATHTHALQQQMEFDTTMLSEATGGFTAAVLKGRSSYYCLLRGAQVEDNYSQVSKTDAFAEDDQMIKVLDWAAQTETGDKSELDFPVTNETWNQVSVSSDQCAGKNCPFFTRCFAEKARARAKTADITILNHALLAQGMRQENFLDGAFDNIIIDEAHEFASVVGEAFGATVTIGKLRWALSQGRRIGTEAQRDQFEGAIERILAAGHGVREPLRHLNDHPILAHVRKMSSVLASWIVILEGNKGEKNYILKQGFYNLMTELDLICKGDTKVQTAWIEWRDDENFTLRSVMFNVSNVIRENLIEQYHSVIFMSATIKTGSSFNPAAVRLGMPKDNWTGAEIPHLFDYEHNGLIWMPGRMKDPSHPEYLSQVAMVSKAAIAAAHGRTLILCTSWKGVDVIGTKLRAAFSKDDFPVIVQRPGVNLRTMAEEFRSNPHSVLVGTRTLWTGMSFEGDTCACVVIDKIPFPSPADPIIAARCEDVEDNGGNAFGSIMVPEASLIMTQGAGRLIRTPSDKGVLVLPDPRLNVNSQFYKQYASRLLGSMPPMPITYDTEVALAKLREIHESS